MRQLKEKTRRISDWSALIELVESLNPYRETIILSGWINEPIGDKLVIRTLVFTTKPVEVLRNDKYGKDGAIKEREGKKTPEGSSKKNT